MIDNKLLKANAIISLLKANSVGDDIEIYNNNYYQAENNGYKEGMAWTLANKGQIHIKLSEYHKGFECFTRSLTICEEHDDKIGMGLNLNSLAWMYQYVNRNLDKALTYTNRSLELFKETKDKLGMSLSYRSLAEIFIVSDKFPETGIS